VSATTWLQAEALIGRRIRVHWVKDKAWYPALVDDYDATKAQGKHHVRYDDVDQWGKLNLTKMVFEVSVRDKRPFEFLDDDGEPPARLLKPSASQSTAGADIVALGKKPPPGQAVSVRRSIFLRHLFSRSKCAQGCRIHAGERIASELNVWLRNAVLTAWNLWAGGGVGGQGHGGEAQEGDGGQGEGGGQGEAGGGREGGAQGGREGGKLEAFGERGTAGGRAHGHGGSRARRGVGAGA